MKDVFGLALVPDDEPVLLKAMEGVPVRVLGSFSPLTLPLGNKEWDVRIETYRSTVETVLRQYLPSYIEAGSALTKAPLNTGQWAIRNAILMGMTRTCFYLVDEHTNRNIDLVTQLLVARLMGIPTVGLLNINHRIGLDSTQLAHADLMVTCGGADVRVLGQLVESLTEDPVHG